MQLQAKRNDHNIVLYSISMMRWHFVNVWLKLDDGSFQPFRFLWQNFFHIPSRWCIRTDTTTNQSKQGLIIMHLKNWKNILLKKVLYISRFSFITHIIGFQHDNLVRIIQLSWQFCGHRAAGGTTANHQKFAANAMNHVRYNKRHNSFSAKHYLRMMDLPAFISKRYTFWQRCGITRQQ